MTSALTTLTANGYGTPVQIGASGKLSIVVRDTSVFGGATVVIANSGNNTNYGRSGVIKDNDTEKTRVVTGIVGEYAKVGAENCGLSTSILVDIVSD